MRTTTPRALLAFSVALSACHGGDARRASHEPGGPGGGDAGGAYVIVGDPDTVATERYTRSPGHLGGRIVHGDGTRIEYDATIARDESIARLELRLWRSKAPPDSPPAERSVTEVRRAPAGDSVVRTDRVTGAPERVLRASVPPGAQPYLLPSVGLAQQLLRRARRLGGDSVRMGIVVLNGAANPQPVTVRWLPGDSAEIAVHGATLRLGLDPDGRIRDGSNAALRMTLKRLD